MAFFVPNLGNRTNTKFVDCGGYGIQFRILRARRWDLSLFSSRPGSYGEEKNFPHYSTFCFLVRKNEKIITFRCEYQSPGSLGGILSNSKDVFTHKKWVLLRKSALDGAIERILRCCNWNWGHRCNSVVEIWEVECPLQSCIIIGKIWYWSVRFDMHACQNAYCNTEFGIDNIKPLRE